MKIRQGFVSNSSSSSFIIKTDGKFKTVYDVAKSMMKDIMVNWGDIYYSEELNTLEQIRDKDTPIFFETSDGTYIRKIKDYIIVSTTQNCEFTSLHSESEDFSNIEEDYFKELEYYDEEYKDDFPESDGIRKIEHCDDFDYYWEQFNDFLILKSGFYGVWGYDWNTTCPDCGGVGRILKLRNGEVLCRCKVTKKYNRALKIKSIENEN